MDLPGVAYLLMPQQLLSQVARISPAIWAAGWDHRGKKHEPLVCKPIAEALCARIK